MFLSVNVDFLSSFQLVSEEEPVFFFQDVKQEEEMETSTNQNGQTEAAPPPQTKPSVASLPLPPHDPDTPIGKRNQPERVNLDRLFLDLCCD